MRFLTLIYCLLWSISMNANTGEEYDFEFINKQYDPDILSVSFDFNDSPVGFQVLRLGSADYVMLKFDDLSNTERNFFYKIIHCDKNWQPSAMREIDYLNGFNDERLRNYSYATNTRIQYLHYWQKFPNKDTNFKISGNYLLVIYEDNIETPILTRRFVVTENSASVDVKSIYPSDVLNIRYKQEMTVDVTIDPKKMRNPIEEVSVVMIQNDNWNQTSDVKPNFLSGSTLRFNKLKNFEWWGNAEFREFDIRSFFRVGRGVKFIERRSDGTDILLEPTLSRRNKVHLAVFDFNGRFFIENWDRLTSGVSIDDILGAEEISSARSSIVGALQTSSRESFRNNLAEERNINSDYANITVNLDDNIVLEKGEEIYILGAFNNYLPSEEYKMNFNSAKDMYTCNLFLKQGYYNFYYGIVDKKGKIDFSKIEGSWNETENDYQVLVYYKGLGDLYDKVIAYRNYNTNSGNKQY
jgi:hypothetical protein